MDPGRSQRLNSYFKCCPGEGTALPPWLLGSGPHGMSPDGGGPAGLLRHSVLCSAKVSPGSGLWPQPDLELLHLCKSKFKHPDFTSQTTLLKPCTSAALLQLASASPHHHLSAVSLPTSPSSPSLQLDPQGPPLPPLSLISTFYSLLPLSSCHIHLAKPQPWINPPSLFFFFPLILQSCRTVQEKIT